MSVVQESNSTESIKTFLKSQMYKHLIICMAMRTAFGREVLTGKWTSRSRSLFSKIFMGIIIAKLRRSTGVKLIFYSSQKGSLPASVKYFTFGKQRFKKIQWLLKFSLLGKKKKKKTAKKIFAKFVPKRKLVYISNFCCRTLKMTST